MKDLMHIFKEAYVALKNAGNESPHLEATWLVEHFTQTTSDLRIRQPDAEVTHEQWDNILAAVRRRIQGEPLAYILGYKEFYSYRFKVSPAVLIPRPETELLVDWALNWIEKNYFNNNAQKELNILDMGTGSGCIGISVLKKVPQAKLTAVDISPEAIRVAKENAQALGVDQRAEFICLDAHNAGHLLQEFHLVLANPPYIGCADNNIEPMVRKYEPSQALFAEDSGFALISEWFKAIEKKLAATAAVGFEIGSGQGAQALALFKDAGIFTQQYIVKDYAKLDRFICGERGARDKQF